MRIQLLRYYYGPRFKSPTVPGDVNGDLPTEDEEHRKLLDICFFFCYCNTILVCIIFFLVLIDSHR